MKPACVSNDTRRLGKAQAEELTLLVADSKTGYLACISSIPASPIAGETRWQERVGLGCFATAEEAALSVARSPEGQGAADRGQRTEQN